jgi:hypothetical protein
MKKVMVVVFALAAMATGCSEPSSGGSGSGGSGGTGGSSSLPASVDQTCRNWCANEPEGLSCHQGPAGSVQDCYEKCLRDYPNEPGRLCGSVWIAIKDCQLNLDCEDLLGDCDPLEDAFIACLGAETGPGPGVGGEEAEVHCQAWCDVTTGCDTAWENPNDCLLACRNDIAKPCGEHLVTYRRCVLFRACDDQDCEQYADAEEECHTALAEMCDACQPDPPNVENTCLGHSGSCDPDWETGLCEYRVRTGECPDVATCLETDDLRCR